MILQVANKISPNNDYVNAALDAISHVFGRNYYNRSYVTGLGINPPMNPHDRRSGLTEYGAVARLPCRRGWPGPKDWVDIQDSYQTNEIAINWNAALIYALPDLSTIILLKMKYCTEM